MTTCPTCDAIGLTCLRCQTSHDADRADDRAPDVVWTPSGPRCPFCSRAMVRWGHGYVCGCGNGIDKNGETL